MEENEKKQEKHEKLIKILSMEEIEKNWNDWSEQERRECCAYQGLSIAFLKAHIDEVFWPEICVNPQTMTKEQSFAILDKFPTKISWASICLNPKPIADTILYNYRYKIIWSMVLQKQELNIQLLIRLSEIYRKSRAKNTRKFWQAVSRYSNINLDYVEAYERFIDFNELSSNPHISEPIMRKYLERLNPARLWKTTDIPKDLVQTHKDFFSNLNQ